MRFWTGAAEGEDEHDLVGRDDFRVIYCTSEDGEKSGSLAGLSAIRLNF
jgi:hypothetical protein